MKHLLPLIVLLFACFSGATQNNPRPTKSRFWNSKYSTFAIKAGDVLIYSFEQDGRPAELKVQVKKFGPDVSFDYVLPTGKASTSVYIPAVALNEAAEYNNSFSKASVRLKDETMLWLSKQSYRDLAADGKTEIDFGEGPKIFNRGNTTTMKIKYKGKEKIITLFNISNQDGAIKRFSLLTDENNPLIVVMDRPSMTLTEVR